jgi:hypothetical protein
MRKAFIPIPLFCWFFFCLIESNGQIIYTDINPDAILFCNTQPACSSNYNCDINNDGTNDLRFTSVFEYFGICSYQGFPLPKFHYTSSVVSVNADCFYGISNNYPAAVDSGLSIGNNYTWTSNSDTLLLYWARIACSLGGSHQGNFYSVLHDKYLPVKIIISGQNYFGWVRVLINGGNAIIFIKGYAYNSIPNQPITAGDQGIITTNIIKDNFLSHLKIFPNPSSGFIKIKFPSNLNGEISIANILGQIVFSQDLINLNEISIDVRALPDGNYFVKFNDKQNVQFRLISILH